MRTSSVLGLTKRLVIAAAIFTAAAGASFAQLETVSAPDTRTLVPPLDIGISEQSSLAFGVTSALDAAQDMASFMDGAGGGVSSAELLLALEGAAASGQPDALWRLGVMYENGVGVQKDQVRAFGYYSRIANEHANTSPRSLEADVVGQSFVKVGDYYRSGLPDAGIAVDPARSTALLMHAATYFGDADAQFRVGELYSTPDGLGINPLQSARWWSLAARKGHIGAQAMLGDLLFNGEGIEAQPVEGLMWLSIAGGQAAGTPDEAWITELLNRNMSIATPEQRSQAVNLADTLGREFRS